MDKGEEQRHVQDEFFQAFDELWGPIVHEMAPVTLPEEIAVLEKKRITNALEANEGNRTRTADQLGIGRRQDGGLYTTSTYSMQEVLHEHHENGLGWHVKGD